MECACSIWNIKVPYLTVDLTQPLSTIAPGLEGDALTVLVRTETPLSGRRVAELARKGSHTSMTRVLERLATHGLVISQPVGRAVLYTLNREHVLASAVLAAVDAGSTLRKRLTACIERWEVQPLHVSLYGSVARTEADSESDIDVLVVRPDALSQSQLEVWTSQLADLERLVFDWSGNHLSWFETATADLLRASKTDEPIFDSWRADSIPLIGPPLLVLIRRQTAS